MNERIETIAVERGDVDAGMQLAAAAERPVLMCPAGGPPTSPAGMQRVLVPLEGEVEPSDAIACQLAELVGAAAEVVVLHVFTPDNPPPVLDRPVRDLELWATEFLSRYFPHATRMECRAVDRRSVGSAIVDVASESKADAIAVAWSRNPSQGHATVVREVLSRSDVPVLLVPVSARRTTRAPEA